MRQKRLGGLFAAAVFLLCAVMTGTYLIAGYGAYLDSDMASELALAMSAAITALSFVLLEGLYLNRYWIPLMTLGAPKRSTSLWFSLAAFSVRASSTAAAAGSSSAPTLTSPCAESSTLRSL